MSDLIANLQRVAERIERACERAQRRPSDVTLVAVSKGHPAGAIQALYDAGHRDFGESYVQEWQEKAEQLPDDIRWHFIGHLQSNKARFLVDRVELVHSVDRKSLMKKLNRRSEQPVDVLLQVNTGDDPNKGGVAPAKTIELLEQALAFEDLRVRGLMTIPPLTEDPERARTYFRTLRESFEEARSFMASHHPEQAPNFVHVSMGMTADFEMAVEEGATIVRVGTAIFGERNYG